VTPGPYEVQRRRPVQVGFAARPARGAGTPFGMGWGGVGEVDQDRTLTCVGPAKPAWTVLVDRSRTVGPNWRLTRLISELFTGGI
jgi:hypothetical protein